MDSIYLTKATRSHGSWRIRKKRRSLSELMFSFGPRRRPCLHTARLTRGCPARRLYGSSALETTVCSYSHSFFFSQRVSSPGSCRQGNGKERYKGFDMRQTEFDSGSPLTGSSQQGKLSTPLPHLSCGNNNTNFTG